MDVQLAAASIDQVHHWPLLGQIGMVLGLALVGGILNRLDKSDEGNCLGTLFYIGAVLLACYVFFG